MWHDAKSELHQKILIVGKFPGTQLICNISIIINTTALKKYFFGSKSKEE